MLKDLNAQERDTITFEVTVNHEGITYKWLKNGVEVKSSDRCQVRSRQLTHTLTIRNVHFGDGGEYQFVAGSAATSANLFVEGNVAVATAVTFKETASAVSPLSPQLASSSSPRRSKTSRSQRRRRPSLNVRYLSPTSR